MEGRAAGTEGERRARGLLVAELERYGVRPAGEDGYLQRVPLVRVLTAQGRPRWTLAGDEARPDTLPLESRREAWNVLGLIPGADPELAHEVVIVGAHYDHVGIGPADEAGDSIYNGADDDGSGTVAILEIARALARGAPPRRTVVVLLATGEEGGLLGARWYLDHPVVPLDSTVADFQIEMIGRPDSLAGGPGRAWLTGYERTTMGEQLAAAGSPVVPDPRPDQRFFFRSDNVPFALAGIPAHTLSSYGMHTDYHQPSDEVDAVDFSHMAAVVDAAVQAVRFLADGPRPEWLPGGRDDFPERR
jgi:Zn-dependent M28 family amino/carboxypeptidase